LIKEGGGRKSRGSFKMHSSRKRDCRHKSITAVFAKRGGGKKEKRVAENRVARGSEGQKWTQ